MRTPLWTLTNGEARTRAELETGQVRPANALERCGGRGQSNERH